MKKQKCGHFLWICWVGR